MSITQHEQDLPHGPRLRVERRGRHRGDGAQSLSRPAVPGAAVGRRRHLPSGAFPRPTTTTRPTWSACSTDPAVEKMFHFARFDLAILQHYLGVMCQPVYCTKIASKLARTYTDRHGLKDLCQDLLGIELSKQMQSSDWGEAELSRGAAQLCRPRRPASAPPARAPGRHAGARAAPRAGDAPASPSCRIAPGSTLPAGPAWTSSPIRSEAAAQYAALTPWGHRDHIAAKAHVVGEWRLCLGILGWPKAGPWYGARRRRHGVRARWQAE